MVELFVDTGTMAEMNDYRSRMLYERPSAEYRQKTTQHCTNYLWQWKIAGCSAVSDLSLFVGEKTVETVMDILEFGRIVGVGDEAVVKYFQDKHLLRKAVQCQPCGREYSLIKKKGSVTGSSSSAVQDAGRRRVCRRIHFLMAPISRCRKYLDPLLGSKDMQLAGDVSHVCLEHYHYPVVSVLPDTFVRGSCCTNHLCSAVLIAVYKSTSRWWLIFNGTLPRDTLWHKLGCRT